MKKFVILLVLLCTSVFAQDKKATPVTVTPLTMEEKFSLRTVQQSLTLADDNVVKAEVALRKAQDELAQKQGDLSQVIGHVYTSRKVSQQEYALCDGPNGAACANVTAGDIMLVPVAEVTKKEKK